MEINIKLYVEVTEYVCMTYYMYLYVYDIYLYVCMYVCMYIGESHYSNAIQCNCLLKHSCGSFITPQADKLDLTTIGCTGTVKY